MTGEQATVQVHPDPQRFVRALRATATITVPGVVLMFVIFAAGTRRAEGLGAIGLVAALVMLLGPAAAYLVWKRRFDRNAAITYEEGLLVVQHASGPPYPVVDPVGYAVVDGSKWLVVGPVDATVFPFAPWNRAELEALVAAARLKPVAVSAPWTRQPGLRGPWRYRRPLPFAGIVSVGAIAWVFAVINLFARL